ncbi:carbohydrate binding family 9 domain-containing protein [Fodinibius saliphilus]|uniref:carbohydrate binding family 9 domain-containing protein n=1 Tax=Fodinibius saliphilus TaxID=1920650 RepID=UPI0011080A20|nr:carbohydrate binding family 9 domain-containing protein [Fodinibius saliphilus]
MKYSGSVLVVLFIVVTQQVVGQSTTDRTAAVKPQSISENFEITADLDQPAWDKAPVIYIKNQVMPDDNASATVQTKVKMLYSKEYLYIGFWAKDPNPQNIRANISDRDKSFRDDFVGVFVDPFNNNQNAYELFSNPLGIQMDGMRSGNNEDMNFDLLWYSEGKITDEGYQVVMKVPFASLNFPDKKVQDWSIQFIRNYPRSTRYQFTWSDVSVDNSCLICQNGEMKGVKNIESSNAVEFLPYGMGYQNSTLKNPENSSNLNHGRINGRIGGSVSYSPNSTSSINAVVNPDFSQVETDAAQIGANETFALYYPEKRPFFMRRSDLFATRENLFYSRMINRPIAAGKYTHQADNFSLAFLTAYDRDSPFLVPGKYSSSLVRSDIDAYNNIFRGKYNFGSESYIGGLFTARNQGEGSNYVGSIDWNILLADQYYFSGQLGYSSTKELDDSTLMSEGRVFGEKRYDAAFNGEQYGGTLVSAEFSREAKYYNFDFEYKSFSPTFQTQSGFINRTDRRQLEASQSIAYYPNKDWLSRGRVSVSGVWRYDFGGQFQERFIYTRWSNNLAGQTYLSFSYLPLNDEHFRGEFFTRLHRTMVNLQSNPMDMLSFGGNVNFGRYIYKSNNPQLGRGYNASVYTTLKPSSRLELSLRYNYSTLSSVEDDQEFYSGSIFRMTGNYNFSRRLFARVITQYNSFKEQIQLYPLVYYKVNPFTKFYIGMTDYMNHFDSGKPDGLGGFTETDRQFFVKFQYLIQS